MFEGFELEQVDVGAVTLRVRHGGQGPPVVLLHGHPRTHTTWYAVAPLLAAAGRTVVCPDLRGYGRSSKPPTDERHTPYSKSVMAQDVADLMTALGHERFAVVGHDRGAQVAFRLAMEHPDRVQRLAFLGVLPIGDLLAHCDARFAAAWWHWFFFAQPEVPERVITADPDAWYRTAGAQERMGSENFEDFRAAVHDPQTVQAMLEDYRAGLTVDREHDDADRARGRRLTCPVLHVWATRDDPPETFPDLRSRWRTWADDVEFATIDTGHHMAEDDPEGLAVLLGGYLPVG